MSEQNSRPQNSERPQRSRRPQGVVAVRSTTLQPIILNLLTTRTQNCWNALFQNAVRFCHVV